MSFSNIKQLVSARFKALVDSGATLLAVDHNRDLIWDAYLNAFPEALQQEHNCNCCKAFVRQIGNVVAINPGTLHIETIWDLDFNELHPEYWESAKALHAYVLSRPIKGLFYHVPEKNKDASVVGTDQNFSEKHQTIFQHFCVTVPKACRGDLAAKSGELKSTFDVLKRGLTELNIDALDTVLELIAQKSLYRGSEYENIVKGLKEMRAKWLETDANQQDNLIWHLASTQPVAICRARNTAIGTLLIDLSEGKPLDAAVSAFEKVMAPANYKRPTALVTPRMVEEAKKTLTELGMISALSRRRLDTRDLGPHNALYVHRANKAVGDIFDALTGPPTVKPQELGKVEEIGIDAFLEKVLPSAKGLRVLVENHHLPNFAALTGAVDPEAPNLFKWASSFGWSYAGGVASSMRERVRAAGGSVSGVIRFTFCWNWDDEKPNASLMDAHVFIPGSKFDKRAERRSDIGLPRVGWNCRQDEKTGGNQDVDYINVAPKGYCPIENITFPDIRKMPNGVYTYMVNNYSLRKPTQSGFQAEIEFGGQIFKYQYEKPLGQSEWVTVAEVELQNGQFAIKHHLTPQNPNQTRWGVTTNQWRTVKAITLSPNHWCDPVGNKHHFFLLEGCVSDEKTRGFYNEFLCQKLQDHRKVTELLADKAEVLPADGAELSGLGFTDTERNHLFVEVEGAFKRIVKVLF